MARPERHDCDYFPFYAKDGRTLYILESKYQCMGTGFFTNVMRFLTLQEDHYFDISDEADRMYFFSKCHCDEKSGTDMLNIMAKTCKIHTDLWVSYKVITSMALLKSLNDAYRNRKNNIITIDEIVQKYVSDISNSQELVVSDVENSQEPDVSDVEKPQRKGKETKVNKTKELFLSDSIEYRLSNYLLKFILKRNPNHKKPNLQAWAIQIDFMLRIDNRAVEDIKKVIQWCQTDSFWQNNILSTKKLREKFDQLFLKIEEFNPKTGSWQTDANLRAAKAFLERDENE